tara:strand:+ start:2160 stop:2477 length:318 start_codon:yes stop_codon:yes gene_type:complete
MNKITVTFILLTTLLLLSCQSVKDGLSGSKRANSDEFLVKKKNPLVIPPKYLELPQPKSSANESTLERIEEETNIEDLIKTNSDTKEAASKNYGKAEDFVLENIK